MCKWHSFLPNQRRSEGLVTRMKLLTSEDIENIAESVKEEIRDRKHEMCLFVMDSPQPDRVTIGYDLDLERIKGIIVKHLSNHAIDQKNWK